MRKPAVTLLAMVSMGVAQAQSGMSAYAYDHTPPIPGSTMPEFTRDSPAALLEKSMGRLLEQLRRTDLDAHTLGQYLDAELAPYFDFSYMAESAAGNMYRYMSTAQRLRMAERIKQQFLSTMVQRLSGFRNQSVNIVSRRLHADGRTGVVTAAIIGPQGFPVRLDFHYYKAPEGWKVYDVLANGQSAVVHYRRRFRQAMYMPGGHNQQRMARSYRQISSGS